MEADKLNFLALLAEFRSQLDAVGPNYLLSVAMGTGPTLISILIWPQLHDMRTRSR